MAVMEMPRPTDAHQKLELLAGSWEGEEKIHPSPWDPKGGTARGRVVNRIALGGFAVVQEYEQKRDGKVNFWGHGVFRWDPPSETYVLHWFDSMGMPPNEYRGKFDQDVLTLTAHTPMGLSRAIFEFGKKGNYSFRMEASPDGQTWSSFMEGTYNRRD